MSRIIIEIPDSPSRVIGAFQFFSMKNDSFVSRSVIVDKAILPNDFITCKILDDE